MTDSEYDKAVSACPAPTGYSWCADPAASGWRLRLFGDRDDNVGQVCAAYVDGGWFVDDPAGGYCAVAHGEESGLVLAMQRALAVSRAVGWDI
jgi:hypothetical protein